MKKGFVALLIMAALIVLVSPGIVGHLAEKALDEQLARAATESGELVLRPEGFDRGWFSSEGRHRVELRGGRLRDILSTFGVRENDPHFPAVVIDTRLDHGLIPVSSLARDNGSLLPGLGSAVSRVSLELADGELVPLPGTIYSTLGLTGKLNANYTLEPGAFTQGDLSGDLHLQIPVTDPDAFSWPDTLLVTEATADITVGENLVQLAIRAYPGLATIVAMGYLRKNGDAYELRAELKDGLLTVNGAPLPLSLPDLQ